MKRNLVFVLILLCFGALTPLAAAGQDQAAAPAEKPKDPAQDEKEKKPEAQDKEQK